MSHYIHFYGYAIHGKVPFYTDGFIRQTVKFQEYGKLGVMYRAA